MQLDQYGKKSTNADFFFSLAFADFDPANIGVPDTL